MKVRNRQGPSQRSSGTSIGVDSWRSMEIDGTGRALVDRSSVPSAPGPHQRSRYPTDSIQLPRLAPKYEPSGRQVWLSSRRSPQ